MANIQDDQHDKPSSDAVKNRTVPAMSFQQRREILLPNSLKDLLLPGSRSTPFVQNFPNAELYELAVRAVIKENNVGGSPGDSRRSADAKRW
jgi:hypothetical protein